MGREPERVEAPSGSETSHQVHPREAQGPRVPKKSAPHAEQEQEGDQRIVTQESPIRGANVTKRVGQEAWRPPSDLRRGLDFGGGSRLEEETRDAGAEQIAEIPTTLERSVPLEREGTATTLVPDVDWYGNASLSIAQSPLLRSLEDVGQKTDFPS